MDYFPSLYLENALSEYCGPAFPIVETPEDNDLVSESGYGYVHARRRFTFARYTFSVSYPLLSDHSKEVLQEFADACGRTVEFYWEHPKTLVWYVVRFSQLPEYQWTKPRYWEASFKLRVSRLADIEDEWGDDDEWGDPDDLPVDVWGI